MKPTKVSGFLCRSQAATAVCVPGDPRSVIVPRRAAAHLMRGGDQARLLDMKYAKLVDSRRFGLGPEKVTRDSITGGRERKNNPSKPSNNSIVKPVVALPPPDHVFQVVVMRVSIHCQGCAGKIKKHISKMEGVTSFSIDLESKRVTVMGHVSPLVVLESISKVKKAEFWP
ncbi:hypothetical protein QJS04_geneDACA014452 [Acorus gramineus]|uniref:HMA domain-containing protein n=1 Tax=Acorus gramineus TaxID=55184 RepID=A0AAV9BKH5_ACOGR|nr:hypothetical protein QJS04_geneDACA014452 [Acorus gramineus]